MARPEKGDHMPGSSGIGTSLILIAAGAILAFAVEERVSGIDIQTVGVILLLIGILGLVMSWLFLSSFSPLERRVHTTYVERPVHQPETPPVSQAPASHTQVNVNPPPAQPESRTEVNVNQPPPETHG